jgi:hypothetical protein
MSLDMVLQDMTYQYGHKSMTVQKSDARQKRLAQALRVNLKRRKAVVRAQQPTDAGQGLNAPLSSPHSTPPQHTQG